MKRSVCIFFAVLYIILVVGCQPVNELSNINIIDITGAESLIVKTVTRPTRGARSAEEIQKVFVKVLPGGIEVEVNTYNDKGKKTATFPPDIIIPCNEQYVILGYDSQHDSQGRNTIFESIFLVNTQNGSVYKIHDGENFSFDESNNIMNYWSLRDEQIIFQSDSANNIYFYDPLPSAYGGAIPGLHKIDVSDPKNIQIITSYIPQALEPDDFTVDNDGNITWYYQDSQSEYPKKSLYLKPRGGNNILAKEDFISMPEENRSDASFLLDGIRYSVVGHNIAKQIINWETGDVKYEHRADITLYSLSYAAVQYDDCVVLLNEYRDGGVVWHDSNGNVQAQEISFEEGYKPKLIYYNPMLYSYDAGEEYYAIFIDKVSTYNRNTNKAGSIELTTNNKFDKVTGNSVQIFYDGSIMCEGTLLPDGNEGVLTIHPDGRRTYEDKGSSSEIIILEKLK